MSSEKQLQAEIALQLTKLDVAHEREVRLGEGDIIDFMIGDVGIEVKIKGGKLDIYRQCKRYCMRDRVSTFVLVSNVALGLPSLINGKPVRFASLARGWL